MTTSQYLGEQRKLRMRLLLLFMIAWIRPSTFAFHVPKVGASRVTIQKQNPYSLFPQKVQTPPRRKIFRFLPLFSSEANSEVDASSVKPKGPFVNGASSDQVNFRGFPGSTSAAVPKGTQNSLLEKVRKASNFASILCALDCTLLPLVTVVLPVLGLLELSAAKLQLLDKLGHSLALYFVLPVGSITTGFNYVSHRKAWISGMAMVGLLVVGIANSHFHLPHGFPAVVANAVHKMQSCGAHPSVWHRISNVCGCALLLGSNYLSQQQDGCAAHNLLGDDDCCGHDHSHDHGH